MWIRIKMNTTITYFQRKVWIKKNPTRDIFKWMFVYYKCYISIELTLLKELMLIKQVHQKRCDMCHYWYFLNYSFMFQLNIWNWCHDLLMMPMNLSDIAILNTEGSDYHWTFSLIRGYKLNAKCWITIRL